MDTMMHNVRVLEYTEASWIFCQLHCECAIIAEDTFKLNYSWKCVVFVLNDAQNALYTKQHSG